MEAPYGSNFVTIHDFVSHLWKKKKKIKTAVIERLSWQLGMQFSGRYRCREVAVRGGSKLYHS